MMKYSPAPWVEIENDDGDVIIQMDKSHSVLIANLEGSCGVCHANARLIQMAPELLEALEAVVFIADRKTDVFDKAHAVIAKAKGQI